MRFLLLLFLFGASLVGLHLVLLYGFMPYSKLGPALDAANAAASLANVPWPVRHLAHNAADYAQLREVAFVLVIVGGLVLSYHFNVSRCEAKRLARDFRHAWLVLGQTWRLQSLAGRLGAVTALLAIAAVRSYYILHNPFNADELVTADYFVAPGPAVTAAFYLLPNNHILSSLMAWPLPHWLPAVQPDLLMRLPAFGLGLGGLIIGFAALIKLTSLRIAVLTTLFFQLSPMAVEYSTTARGYGPQTLCVQALLLASLVLLRGPVGHRLAWTVWVGASVAGFYLIPTFLYPFLGLGVGMLLAGRGRAGALLRRQVLVAGTGVVALAALLYLPVGWLTGWPLLMANPYVARVNSTIFWRNLFSYYLPITIVILYGRAIMGWALLGLLTLAPLAAVKWMPSTLRPSAWLAWAGAAAPLPMLIAQHVMPPARTVHYTVWLVILLVCILLETIATKRGRKLTALWALVGLVGGGYTMIRLTKQAHALAEAQVYDQSCQQAENWLSARHPQRILTTVPGYELYLIHRALAQGKHRPAVQFQNGWPPVRNAIPKVYDYLVLARAEAPPTRPTPFKARFYNRFFCVYQRLDDARRNAGP